MPPGLLVPDLAWRNYQRREDEHLQLKLRALCFCRGGEHELELFIGLVRYLVERYEAFVPSPTKAEQLVVSSGEVAERLGASEREIAQLYWLLRGESDLFNSLNGAPENWSVSVRSAVRDYRQLRDASDYFGRRPTPASEVAPWGELSSNDESAAPVTTERRRGLQAVLPVLAGLARHPLIVLVIGTLIVAAITTWLGLR